MKCKVCRKEAVSVYCKFHERAYENLVNGYEEWKRALNLSWREYLNKVIKNEYSGSWVKEVAEQLLKGEE
jgi:hypothetical protein